MEASREALMPMRKHRRSGRMSLTPLIDVVFILLIFFMLQTNFLRPRSLEFAHSVGDANASQSDTTLIAVELHANGSVWLNGAESSMDGLRTYASRVTEPENARVVLGVDPDVFLQRAVDVMDLFNQFNLSNISMSAAKKFE